MTDYNYDEQKTEIENFDWKTSKPYIMDSIDIDLLLRVSEQEVMSLNKNLKIKDINKKAPKRESKYYNIYRNRTKDLRNKNKFMVKILNNI